MSVDRRRLHQDILLRILLVGVVILISLPSLASSEIDGLDSAHHLLDGYFFRDLIASHGFTHLPRFALSYYKQYPALGFVFWPPLTPAVFGLFDLAGGAHVITTRVCMVCFGAVFALALYAALRRQFSPALSFAAAVSAVTVPGISRSLNEIMLELPTLTFMMLAVLACRHFTEHMQSPGGIRRTILCAAACAAVVYSKQPAWFLYPALLFEFALNHRPALKTKTFWLCIGLTGLLCVPLAVYTLKFGHANLAQSVGSNTRLIMSGYEEIPRWSMAAWTFYPRLSLTLLNPVVVPLALAALIIAAVRKSFLRYHALWIGWFVMAYLTFSFYDNRVARHATFWWPAWIVLAAACLSIIEKSLRPGLSWIPAALLLVPVPLQVHSAFQRTYGDFQGERYAISGLFGRGNPGNFLLFGRDKQVFVALIREYDRNLNLYAIRGDALIGAGQALSSICHDYRIGTVLVEAPTDEKPIQNVVLTSIIGSGQFVAVQSPSFLRNGVSMRAYAFRYTGPVADHMAPISLSNRLM